MPNCEYCTLPGSNQRCAGCKKAFYCSKACQKKHWKLMHKRRCKILKNSDDDNRDEAKKISTTMDEFELNLIDLDLHRQMCNMRAMRNPNWDKQHAGPKIGAVPDECDNVFAEVIDDDGDDDTKETADDSSTKVNSNGKRSRQNNRSIKGSGKGSTRRRKHKSELKPGMKMFNVMMSVIVSAFDKDKDGLLNFYEWRTMLQSMQICNINFRELWTKLLIGINYIPPYEASLSSGCYGTFVYRHWDPAFIYGLDAHEAVESIKQVYAMGYDFEMHTHPVFDDDDDDAVDPGSDAAENYELFRALLTKLHLNAAGDFDLFSCDDERVQRWLTAKALCLIPKLTGHAQALVCLDSTSKADVYTTIEESIPIFNDDICLVIYTYMTYVKDIFHISWHRLQWTNLVEDQYGLWKKYRCRNCDVPPTPTTKTTRMVVAPENIDSESDSDSDSDGAIAGARSSSSSLSSASAGESWTDKDGNHKYFDIFYLVQIDEKGFSDVYYMFEICDDRRKCTARCSEFGDPFANMENYFDAFEEPKDRWCLGMCGAYIPMFSFNMRDHATLLTKVMEFHELNPQYCHSIYVGKEFHRLNTKHKKQIIRCFNNMHNTNTLLRRR